MANCPSALATAMTHVENIPSGVALTITASDPDSRRRLSSLGEVHQWLGEPDGAAREHSGMHGGSGEVGHCPIIHVGTLVSITPIPNGLYVEVRAPDPLNVDKLRADTRARVERLPAWLVTQ
ncbi:MAG: hypothetical protein ABI867_15605 [Kofleriaceae bacterium]